MTLIDNVWYINGGDGSTTGYYALTAWATGVAKVCGNIIRQSATPAVGSERVFVCIAAGTTGGTEPTWTVTRGAKNTDNTATWQEATGVGALNGDLTNTPNWTAVKGLAVTLGQVIKNNAGTLVLICSTAGTAGSGAEPSWAAYTTAGATTADNTATWTTLGASFSNWAAPHARFANVFATGWGNNPGSTCYITSIHNETIASSATIGPTSSSMFGGLTKVLCVNAAGSVPPVSADLLTTPTASYAATGNNGPTIQNAYYRGIKFTGGSGANAAGVTTSGRTVLRDCALVKGGTSSNPTAITLGSSSNSYTELNNTTVQFGHTGDSIRNNYNAKWTSTPSAIQGATIPTALFNPSSSSNAGTMIIDGVDLSALATGATLLGGQLIQNVIVRNCKIGSGVTVAPVAAASFNSASYFQSNFDLINCDSGATNYRNERYRAAGFQVTDTTVVRTGGASDGAQNFSSKITVATTAVGTTQVSWLDYYEALPLAIWNATVGSPITVTVYATWGGGAVPNNDDIWMLVEYLGSSASPIATLDLTTTKGDVLAVGSACASDASSWSGGTTPFKMAVTITPQMAGYIYIYPRMAKSGATFWIDPKPSINGVTVSKSAMLAPGVYTNELSSGSAAVLGVVGS